MKYFFKSAIVINIAIGLVTTTGFAGTLPLPSYNEPQPPNKKACKIWSEMNPDEEMYQT